MSYKIVRITGLYNEYVQQYKAAFPGIINSGSYQEQYDHLIHNSFDTASSISNQFRKMGVDATDIFANVPWIQSRWKLENNSNKSGSELLFEQLRFYKPNVVWIDNLSLIDDRWVNYVKTNIPSIKIVTGLVCAPYSSADVKTLKQFNFVATCTPCLNKEIEKNGMRSFLIYHGFDAHILELINKQNSYPDTDLLFTGSLYTGGGYHKSRIEYLEEFLKAKIPIKIYGKIDPTSKVLTKMGAYYAINMLKNIGAKSLVKYIPLLNRYESFGDTPIQFYSRTLKASLVEPVYGIDQFKLLSKAKICFNIHGEIAQKCAGNLRLFEATGVGTCLVTDWKDNLSALFEIDKEIIAYKSKEECIDKIKWLLDNPIKAAEIAKAGQARVLRDHTIENRTTQLDEIIKSNL